MPKRLLYILLAIGLLALLGGMAGFADFTDQATVTGNAFSSGTVDLVLGQTTALVTYPVDMEPGDSTGSQSLLVTNNGTLDLSYTMSTTMVTDTGTPKLGDTLELTIWQDLGQVGCATGPGVDGDGDALYGVVPPVDLNGGALAERPLDHGTHETLCFLVVFPSSATGPQGASANATFVFDATQD